MLIFTNRDMNGGATESAFGTSFKQGSERLGLATVSRSGKRWSVSAADNDVDDADSKKALLPLFKGERPVLVYVHGNNNTPAKCFERCAKLEALYDVEVIGFSWPSEGYLSDGEPVPDVDPEEVDGDEEELGSVKGANRKESKIRSKIYRYHQAGLNGKHSADALARFFRMIGAARLDANKQPYSVAAHSLGAQFLQYTMDIPAAAESLATAQNVALLAPCVRAIGHREWLAKIRPNSQLFVTFNDGDTVLAGASIADNGLTGDTQLKLGTDPTADRFKVPYMRYISCSNAKVGGGGRGYFVQDKMPKKMLSVFGRIFRSKRDLEAGEIDRKIYGIKGDEDGLTCYFNAPDQ
ncbi:alpha/beta hydrolase [Variovorax paradoxus]|nr:alpha/beta hydrolase [Variovorax paradoxus]MBT2304881.1 alpha/beta hydrolase [Variovorax paradoxus]